MWFPMPVRQRSVGLRAVLLLACLFCARAEVVEDAVTPVAAAVAGTLLGAITFMMSMFYCMHHDDEDMRMYTYEAISGTISIFCAVLIFSTLDDVLDEYVLESMSDEIRVGAAMVQMLVWFIMLQIALGFKSGAVGESRRKIKTSELSQTDLTEIKINLKSYSIMLSHITGFAAINAWGSLQQLPYYRVNTWQPFAVVVVSALGQFLLQRICDTVREKYCMYKDEKSGPDDELEDSARKGPWKDEREQLWIEETADAEVDVMGLMVSFNSCQALRFAISGVFPDQEGKETWSVLVGHPFNECVQLVGAGFGDLLMMLMVCYIKHHFGEQIYRWLDVEESRSIVALMLDCTITTLTMINAWTWFYGGQWLFAGLNAISKDSMLLSVVLTMMVSLMSFTTIWVLDKLADRAQRNMRHEMEHGIRSTIYSFSFLIGFGWEQCFDRAVVALSECVSNAFPNFPNCEALSKVILVGFVVVLVGPAWKTYILPMVVHQGWEAGVVIHDENAPAILRKISDHLTEHAYQCRQKNQEINLGQSHEEVVTIVRGLHSLIHANTSVQIRQEVTSTIEVTEERQEVITNDEAKDTRRFSTSRNRMSTSSASYERRFSVQQSDPSVSSSAPCFGERRSQERSSRFLDPRTDSTTLNHNSKTSLAEKDLEVAKLKNAITELKDSSIAFLEKQNQLVSENAELKASLDRLKQELQLYHRGELDRIKGVRDFSNQMGCVLDTISQIETQMRDTSPERPKAKASESCSVRTAPTSQSYASLEERLNSLRSPMQPLQNLGVGHPLQAPLLGGSLWPQDGPTFFPADARYEAYHRQRQPMG